MPSPARPQGGQFLAASFLVAPASRLCPWPLPSIPDLEIPLQVCYLYLIKFIIGLSYETGHRRRNAGIGPPGH